MARSKIGKAYLVGFYNNDNVRISNTYKYTTYTVIANSEIDAIKKVKTLFPNSIKHHSELLKTHVLF